VSVWDSVTLGRKDNSTAVRSPPADDIESRMVGKPFRVASRGRHNVHVRVARNDTRESNARAVGREARLGFDAGRGGKAASLPAVAGNNPKIGCIFEGNQVVTHGRLTKESRSLGGSAAGNSQKKDQTKDQ
jgi:hypothetical protein